MVLSAGRLATIIAVLALVSTAPVAQEVRTMSSVLEASSASSQLELGSDLDADEQLQLELLRTNTETIEQLVEARRYRREKWFADPTGRIGLCNVPLPVRVSH